jgi:hypothetical protein
MADRKIKCVIVADSRGTPFRTLSTPNKDKYSIEYLIRRGATIRDLLTDTLYFLYASAFKGYFIILLCAGINNLTKLNRHEGGIELTINERQNVIVELENYKSSVRKQFPRCVISFASIPIVDFHAANKHYISSGKLRFAKQTLEQLDKCQDSVSDSLKAINHWIFCENQIKQPLEGIGCIGARQLYLHQYVEKTNSKRTKSGRKVIKRRICPNALIDGIHPTYDLAVKWYDAIHANFLKIIEEIVANLHRNLHG